MESSAYIPFPWLIMLLSSNLALFKLLWMLGRCPFFVMAELLEVSGLTGPLLDSMWLCSFMIKALRPAESMARLSASPKLASPIP